MIRKLHEADRAQLVDLLMANPAYNLYMLGNLDKIGFEAPFCEFWGCFDGDHLTGVVNRYFAGWVVFGLPHANWQALADLIDADPHASRLQDNPGGIDSIVPYLRQTVVSLTSLAEVMRLDAPDFNPQHAPATVCVRRATQNDLEALVAFFNEAGSMSRTRAGVERPLHDTTVFLAEEPPAAGTDDDAPVIVSTALTNAETRSMAMVGGVYTPAHQRGKGYARAVTSALCADLLARNITPYLYWQTPAAGRVYRTLGFHPVGTWRALVLKPRAPSA